jgi:hypothetical protein
MRDGYLHRFVTIDGAAVAAGRHGRDRRSLRERCGAVHVTILAGEVGLCKYLRSLAAGAAIVACFEQEPLFRMDAVPPTNIIPLFPEQADDESTTAGWDPYIFSIVANVKRPYREERRRAPRINTPMGRRALLLAKRKRK